VEVLEAHHYASEITVEVAAVAVPKVLQVQAAEGELRKLELEENAVVVARLPDAQKRTDHALQAHRAYSISSSGIFGKDKRQVAGCQHQYSLEGELAGRGQREMTHLS
jgi:hypothetical protein